MSVQLSQEDKKTLELITYVNTLRGANQYSEYLKKYSFLLPVFFGIGGFGLMGFGLKEYLQTKTFGWMGISGSSSSALAIILCVYEFCKKYQIGSDTSSTPTSLIDALDSKDMTLAEACKVMGITEAQKDDKSLIEMRKKAKLEDCNNTLGKLPTSAAKLRTSIETMIHNLNAAYVFLVKVETDKDQ